MAAADDMRRIVRRAWWRPEAVLRRLWAADEGLMVARMATDGAAQGGAAGGVSAYLRLNPR
jgi:hypothetical protein